MIRQREDNLVDTDPELESLLPCDQISIPANRSVQCPCSLSRSLNPSSLDPFLIHFRQRQPTLILILPTLIRVRNFTNLIRLQEHELRNPLNAILGWSRVLVEERETDPERLKKGLDAVQKNAGIFSSDQAMVVLGVGKNMVQSIRHWCLTTRVLEPEDKDQRSTRLKITPLGDMLFGPQGIDPYLEDIGTLWLLHWLIVSNEAKATTWRWAFCLWAQTEFSREQILSDLRSTVSQSRVARVTDSSLSRDIETFLHTYLLSRSAKSTGEDIVGCPLVELRLLREDPVSHRIEFVRGPKPTLPDAVFGYALAEFWESFAGDRNSLTFEDIQYRAGSPGRAFKLDENSMLERLERAEGWSRDALYFDQTAGLRQVLRRAPIDKDRLLKEQLQPSASAAA